MEKVYLDPLSHPPTYFSIFIKLGGWFQAKLIKTTQFRDRYLLKKENLVSLKPTNYNRDISESIN